MIILVRRIMRSRTLRDIEFICVLEECVEMPRNQAHQLNPAH